MVGDTPKFLLRDQPVHHFLVKTVHGAQEGSVAEEAASGVGTKAVGFVVAVVGEVLVAETGLKSGMAVDPVEALASKEAIGVVVGDMRTDIMVAMVRHRLMRLLGLADVEAGAVVGMVVVEVVVEGLAVGTAAAVGEEGMEMVDTVVAVEVVGMIVIAVDMTVKVEALGTGSPTPEGIAVTVEMTDTMTVDIPESVRMMAGKEDTVVAAVVVVEVTATAEDTRRGSPLKTKHPRKRYVRGK